MHLKAETTVFELFPFVHVLSFNKKGSYCDFCFKKSKNLLRCSKCKFMHYCTRECQKSDWSIHKTECKQFETWAEKQSTNKCFTDDFIRFYLRILIKIKINNKSNETDSYGLKTFNTLNDHFYDLSDDIEKLKHMKDSNKQIKELMSAEFFYKFSQNEFITIFGKAITNKFEIKENNETIGLGMYLSISTLRHSCVPNCTINYNGATILIRTIRDLQPSEEPLISYCDPTLSDEFRREFLKKNYYFKCKCKKCNQLNIDVDFEIFLPCGFTASYKELKNQPELIDCIVCKTHKLNVKECFDMPRNKLSLAQKTYEHKLDYLEKLKSSDNIKTFNEVSIDSEFDRLKSIVDLRREELKKRIDDYYFEMLEDIEKKRKIKLTEIQNKHEKKEIHEIIKCPSSNASYASKMKFYEQNLNFVLEQINNYEEKVNQNSQEIFDLKKNKYDFNLEKIFGRILLSEKYLIKNLKFKFKQEYVGHVDFINFAKFMSNDKIISSSDHGLIKIWNKETGECINSIDVGRHDPVLMVIDDKHFIADQSEKLKIWNVDTCKCVKTLKRDINGIFCAKVLRNGELILSSAIGIELWDLKNGKCIKSIITNCPLSFEETNNGMILGGSRDLLIRLWERDLSLDISFKGHSDIILSLKTLTDDLFASGSRDRLIKIWSIKSGECVKTLEGHEEKIMLLDLIETNYLISGCNKGLIKLWNLENYNCLKTFSTKDCRFTHLNESKTDLIRLIDEKKIELWTNSLNIFGSTFVY